MVALIQRVTISLSILRLVLLYSALLLVNNISRNSYAGAAAAEETCVVTDDGTCSTTNTDAAASEDKQDEPSSSTLLDLSTLQQAQSFQHFLNKIWDINDNYTGTNRTEQEWLVLQGVFAYVDMDSNVLLQKNDDEHNNNNNCEFKNWYQELHRRILALAPPDCFFIVYHTKPTEKQVELMLHIDPEAAEEARSQNNDGVLDDREFRRHAFQPFRHRGGIAAAASMFQIGILNPLKYWIGFAVPSDAVVQAIGALLVQKDDDSDDDAFMLDTVIEVGAGTGYWSSVLQQHGVNAVAYDAYTTETNVYFHHTYTTVHTGTCESIFSPQTAPKAAMLMVWPNNPDNEDNDEQFHSPELPPTWDADCLATFMRAGGTTVIFVGEREERIHVMPSAPAESGLSATRRFQTMLEQHFILQQQIDIPQWWYSDDATIWRRRRGRSDDD